MLTAITGDRMLAILFPLKMGSFRLKHARGVALCGWVVGFLFSVLPAFKLPYFGNKFFGRTGKWVLIRMLFSKGYLGYSEEMTIVFSPKNVWKSVKDGEPGTLLFRQHGGMSASRDLGPHNNDIPLKLIFISNITKSCPVRFISHWRSRFNYCN